MTVTAKGQFRYLLLKYLGPQKFRVTILAVLLLADIVFQLLNPQIMRDFIDSVTGKNELSKLLQLAGLYIMSSLMAQFLSVIVTYISELIGWHSTNKLREDLTLHCLELDMSFHNSRTPGELIERIDGDVTALANFFSRFVLNILGSLILVLGILLVLFRETWLVGLALTLFTIFAAGFFPVPSMLKQNRLCGSVLPGSRLPVSSFLIGLLYFVLLITSSSLKKVVLKQKAILQNC